MADKGVIFGHFFKGITQKQFSCDWNIVESFAISHFKANSVGNPAHSVWKGGGRDGKSAYDVVYSQGSISWKTPEKNNNYVINGTKLV